MVRAALGVETGALQAYGDEMTLDWRACWGPTGAL